MITSMNLSNKELMDYAEEHIQYEYDMLFWSANVLAFLSPVANKGIIDWVVFNGLLNTFAIHSRNLTLFIYSGNKDNTQKTDVVIENYIDIDILTKNKPKISKILNTVIKKS